MLEVLLEPVAIEPHMLTTLLEYHGPDWNWDFDSEEGSDTSDSDGDSEWEDVDSQSGDDGDEDATTEMPLQARKRKDANPKAKTEMAAKKKNISQVPPAGLVAGSVPPAGSVDPADSVVPAREVNWYDEGDKQISDAAIQALSEQQAWDLLAQKIGAEAANAAKATADAYKAGVS